MHKRLLCASIVLLCGLANGAPPRPGYTRLTNLELTGSSGLDLSFNPTDTYYTPRLQCSYTDTGSRVGYVTFSSDGWSDSISSFSGIRFRVSATSSPSDPTEIPVYLYFGSGSTAGFGTQVAALYSSFDPDQFDHGIGLGDSFSPWGSITLVGKHDSSWASGVNTNHSGPIQWKYGFSGTNQYSIFSRDTGKLRMMTGYSNCDPTTICSSTAILEWNGQDPDRDGDATVERMVVARYVATTNATVTGTAEATALNTSGAVGSPGISANVARIGQSYRFNIRGLLTTDASAGNMTVNIKLGGTTILSTGSIALTNSTTERYFEIDAFFTLRTVGAASTFLSQGKTLFATTSSSTVTIATMTDANLAAPTADLTANQAFDVTVQFDNSGNTLSITNAIIEQI